MDEYQIQTISFPTIDTSSLIAKVGPYGFSGSDKRELNKLSQWEKFHVFDPYFTQWKRIVYLDAGIRVLAPIQHLLDLEFENVILAPNDAGDGPNKNNAKILKYQISEHDPEIVKELISEFKFPRESDTDFMESHYFLNCLWVFDTKLITDVCDKTRMIEIMNKYPVCRTNEMTVMNFVFRSVWKPFPWKTMDEKKFLFEWCELNHNGTTWSQYCFIKYPVTIGFEQLLKGNLGAY
jgi:lipopolysaccharide biosynthesis glycosyltransferase